jgi:hypothetical protein
VWIHRGSATMNDRFAGSNDEPNAASSWTLTSNCNRRAQAGARLAIRSLGIEDSTNLLTKFRSCASFTGLVPSLHLRRQLACCSTSSTSLYQYYQHKSKMNCLTDRRPRNAFPLLSSALAAQYGLVRWSISTVSFCHRCRRPQSAGDASR